MPAFTQLPIGTFSTILKPKCQVCKSPSSGPGASKFFKDLLNWPSKPRPEEMRVTFSRGYYVCSRCYRGKFESQRLCDKCRGVGEDTKEKRKAGIPPQGSKWAKGKKRGSKGAKLAKKKKTIKQVKCGRA
ncbi:hypothetical protein N0V85_008370 [Neurospora sp. IMI 360204]|nr:hypothetical protein N0V85_008370 [Neurospora sp. IMI 360204]